MTQQPPPERLLELTETLVAAYNAKDFARLANLLSAARARSSARQPA